MCLHTVDSGPSSVLNTLATLKKIQDWLTNTITISISPSTVGDLTLPDLEWQFFFVQSTVDSWSSTFSGWNGEDKRFGEEGWAGKTISTTFFRTSTHLQIDTEANTRGVIITTESITNGATTCLVWIYLYRRWRQGSPRQGVIVPRQGGWDKCG